MLEHNHLLTQHHPRVRHLHEALIKEKFIHDSLLKNCAMITTFARAPLLCPDAPFFTRTAYTPKACTKMVTPVQRHATNNKHALKPGPFA
jgi:hypothetical protein